MFIIRNEQIRELSKAISKSFVEDAAIDYKNNMEKKQLLLTQNEAIDFVNRMVDFSKEIYIRKEKNILKIIKLMALKNFQFLNDITESESNILYSSTLKEDLKIKFFEDLINYYSIKT